MSMTPGEAIKILSELHDQCCQADSIFCTDTTGARCEAVDMAISALQAQDVPDTNVGDTVSRQAAIDALCKRCDLVADEDEPCTEKCNDIKILEMLPSAQPEIVRCKDCKHRASYWGNCRLLEEKYHQSVLVDGDSFCSMAERRTDERTD